MEAVRQNQVVVAWIQLWETKKLREPKTDLQLTQKAVNCFSWDVNNKKNNIWYHGNDNDNNNDNRDTDDKKSGKSWHWFRGGSLKRKTESLLSPAQEQALNTNSVRKIYHKDVLNKSRLCGECSTHSMLAQKHYKRRHDKVCLNIHWGLCKKYGVKVCERWFEHKVESVIENNIVKILWDVCIQVDR